ncbi:hypothetical protein GDO78_021832 [Eleutherodactylus coqui]|uniref:Uncharacterized protein n=1 Tax=Eleutherodactylus coqui TaxID=57060 RepID=A0A8J6EMB6_ELECQ|nr:hypothetical protein GDO78_021832 [Eleutherodactylus coqui]
MNDIDVQHSVANALRSRHERASWELCSWLAPRTSILQPQYVDFLPVVVLCSSLQGSTLIRFYGHNMKDNTGVYYRRTNPAF